MNFIRIDFGKTLQVLTKLGEEIYIELSGKTNGVNRKWMFEMIVFEILFLVKFSYS